MSETVIASKAAPVRFENVTKSFGRDVVAVDNIDLHIEAGKLVTLLGPSGCGKTTTLRMIAGLEMATSGRILIGDRDVTTLPATDRDVSMVFQSYALFPHMSVLENVSYGLTFSGFSKTETKARALAGLELVGLKGFDARLPSELSGGQQQRVAVARALVLEPQVLLFDEPLSNLDAKLRRQVREDIRAIQQDLGLTVVYVTHDQEEALAVSGDRGLPACSPVTRPCTRTRETGGATVSSGDRRAKRVQDDHRQGHLCRRADGIHLGGQFRNDVRGSRGRGRSVRNRCRGDRRVLEKRPGAAARGLDLLTKRRL